MPRRLDLRRLALLVALAFALAFVPRGAAASESRIFLTAGGPYGAAGATDRLGTTCSDSTRRDTLYLCFEPARDESTFFGFSGEMRVYAPPGDTLGAFWEMERGGANNGGLTMQFGPDETFPQPQPWATVGVGNVRFERVRSEARLRFLYVVPYAAAGPVSAGRRYVLGRIVLGARHPGLAGCERQACIEWRSASFAFAREGPTVVSGGASCRVARGGDAADCRGRVPAWLPNELPPAGPKR